MKYLVISSSQHKKDSNISHQPILATWVPPLSIVKLTSNCHLTVALNCNSPLVPMAAPNFNTLLNQLLQLHLLPTAAASCTDLSWRCTPPAQLCQGCSLGWSLHQLPHILAVQAILLWKKVAQHSHRGSTTLNPLRKLIGGQRHKTFQWRKI